MTDSQVEPSSAAGHALADPDRQLGQERAVRHGLPFLLVASSVPARLGRGLLSTAADSGPGLTVSLAQGGGPGHGHGRAGRQGRQGGRQAQQHGHADPDDGAAAGPDAAPAERPPAQRPGALPLALPQVGPAARAAARLLPAVRRPARHAAAPAAWAAPLDQRSRQKLLQNRRGGSACSGTQAQLLQRLGTSHSPLSSMQALAAQHPSRPQRLTSSCTARAAAATKRPCFRTLNPEPSSLSVPQEPQPEQEPALVAPLALPQPQPQAARPGQHELRRVPGRLQRAPLGCAGCPPAVRPGLHAAVRCASRRRPSTHLCTLARQLSSGTAQPHHQGRGSWRALHDAGRACPICWASGRSSLTVCQEFCRSSSSGAVGTAEWRGGAQSAHSSRALQQACRRASHHPACAEADARRPGERLRQPRRGADDQHGSRHAAHAGPVAGRPPAAPAAARPLLAPPLGPAQPVALGMWACAAALAAAAAAGAR